MQRSFGFNYNKKKLSPYGEPFPYEDDTAKSLIRREGYPPCSTYDQLPEVYKCPCCKNINLERKRYCLVHTAKEEKDLEHRRLMQLDVFDERAKTIRKTSSRLRISQHRSCMVDEVDKTPFLPPPPPTVDCLKRSSKEANKTKLIVTVHYGRDINVDPRDPVSVLVRCGAFEGQTVKVPRGKGAACTWEELFEFPYPNETEPLEVLAIDDALPEEVDHVFGGIVVPPYALRHRQRGDEESLPVCPVGEMHRNYGRMKETPMGAIIVSWYVKRDNEVEEHDKTKQNLDGPLDCVFVVHRIFQYADNGSEVYGSGILSVLRDTDDNCSDSAMHLPGNGGCLSTSPYYTKEGYDYLPQSSAQLMQFSTAKKLGHILVCVARGEDAGEDVDDKELLVVGAVPLDFEKLYHKGSAVLLVESKAKEEVLWGEITIEWKLIPHADVQKQLEDHRKSQSHEFNVYGDSDKREKTGRTESLFITVVRGLNLSHRDKAPVSVAQVSVLAGAMERSTFEAANEKEEENTNVVHWNQEVRFIELDDTQNSIDVHLLENNQTVSSGRFLIEDDQSVVVVKMHDPYDETSDLGEIVISYNRVRSNNDEPSEEYETDYEGDNNRDKGFYSGAKDDVNANQYNEDYRNDDDDNIRKSLEDDGGVYRNSRADERQTDRDIKGTGNESIDRESDGDEPKPHNEAPLEEQKYVNRDEDDYRPESESRQREYFSHDRDETRVRDNESDHEHPDRLENQMYQQRKAVNDDNDDYKSHKQDAINKKSHHDDQVEVYADAGKKATSDSHKKAPYGDDKKVTGFSDKKAPGGDDKWTSGDSDMKATGVADKKATGDDDKRATGDSQKNATGDSDKKARGGDDKWTSGDSDMKATGVADKKATGDDDKRATGDSQKNTTGDSDKKARGGDDKKATGIADKNSPGGDDKWTSGDSDMKATGVAGMKSPGGDDNWRSGDSRKNAPGGDSDKKATGVADKKATGDDDKRATGDSDKKARGGDDKWTSDGSDKKATADSHKKSPGSDDKWSTGDSRKNAPGGDSDKKATGGDDNWRSGDSEMKATGVADKKAPDGSDKKATADSHKKSPGSDDKWSTGDSRKNAPGGDSDKKATGGDDNWRSGDSEMKATGVADKKATGDDDKRATGDSDKKARGGDDKWTSDGSDKKATADSHKKSPGGDDKWSTGDSRKNAPGGDSDIKATGVAGMKSPGGDDNWRSGDSRKNAPGGDSDMKATGVADKKAPDGSDKKAPGDDDKKAPGGDDKWSTGDSRKNAPGGDSDKKATGVADKKATGDDDKRATGDSQKNATGDSDKKARGGDDKWTSGDSDMKATGVADKKATGDDDKRATGDSRKNAPGGDSDKKATGGDDNWRSGDSEMKATGVADKKAPDGSDKKATVDSHKKSPGGDDKWSTGDSRKNAPGGDSDKKATGGDDNWRSGDSEMKATGVADKKAPGGDDKWRSGDSDMKSTGVAGMKSPGGDDNWRSDDFDKKVTGDSDKKSPGGDDNWRSGDSDMKSTGVAGMKSPDGSDKNATADSRKKSPGGDDKWSTGDDDNGCRSPREKKGKDAEGVVYGDRGAAGKNAYPHSGVNAENKESHFNDNPKSCLKEYPLEDVSPVTYVYSHEQGEYLTEETDKGKKAQSAHKRRVEVVVDSNEKINFDSWAGEYVKEVSCPDQDGERPDKRSGQVCDEPRAPKYRTPTGLPPTPEMRYAQTTESVRRKDVGRRNPLELQSIPQVKGPWYPAGSTMNEDHVPLIKRESFRQRENSIRELERRSRGSGRSSARRSSQGT